MGVGKLVGCFFIIARKGENKMAVVGRPPMYKTKEEIQERIDAYFDECAGQILTDKDGMPMFDKYGNVLKVGTRPPTITGLALALGFNSRQSLLNYQDKEEFVDTITRAKSRVECYVEERLFDKDGANGAKFNLANNFKGWSEKQQIEADVNSTMKINVTLVD